MRINVLPKSIYNKIAAGEVVERPQAVVKELVENSIDSKATFVEISVCGGGLDKIEVVDDGCGIEADQLETAFEKHATSKISVLEDLFSITTMGFRGEALSSIGAVSNVKLISRTADAECATAIEINGGEVGQKYPVQKNVGTTVIVENLFYNVPARKKFLKTPSKEASEITNYVSRLILTQPKLKVKYSLDGKPVYMTNGGGLQEAIFTVYGAECLDSCLKIDSQFKNIFVKGYIGCPDYFKANSTYQTFSINGRLVKDTTLSIALKNAFKPYLMSKTFPFCVLDLEMNPMSLDVNVHPSKTEVRFESPADVFLAVYVPVKTKLKSFAERKTDVLLQQSSQTEEETEIFVEEERKTVDDNKAEPQSMGEVIEQERKEFQEQYADYLREVDKIKVKDYLLDLSQLKLAQETVLPVDDIRAYRIVGVLFSTYVVIEMGDKILLVDQHAGHERVLFDKLFSERGFDMQPMFSPYVFSVNEKESEFISENLSSFGKIGIGLEPFGVNTFRVTSIATQFIDVPIAKFIHSALSFSDDIYLDTDEILTQKLAKKACRAAIKAGYKLSETEIDYLIRQIAKNKHYTCPHGRPIALTITKLELEKMFKRVV